MWKSYPCSCGSSSLSALSCSSELTCAALQDPCWKIRLSRERVLLLTLCFFFFQDFLLVGTSNSSTYSKRSLWKPDEFVWPRSCSLGASGQADPPLGAVKPVPEVL